MSAVSSLLRRVTSPPILPIPTRKSGNNVPHSLHKTRRTWRPNIGRYNFPVNLLGGADAVAAAGASAAAGWGVASGRARRPEIKGVKMRAREVRDVDKAGGLEGLLLSRPSKHFTAHGRALRHALFTRLLEERDALRLEPRGRAEAGLAHAQVDARSAGEVPLIGQ
ncbi:hypothetical protein Q5752_006927 [Cryptotrichosporon argae]